MLYEGGEDPVEIPTLQLDDSDGDEYIQVANLDDFLLWAKAAGFESIEDFNKECEFPADQLIGKFFLIMGKAKGQFNKQPVIFKGDPPEILFDKLKAGV